MSKAFKKAFLGGFSKKDVIQYIAELEKKNMAEAAETADKLASERELRESLEEKLKTLTESEKAAISRAQSLERELYEEKDRAAGLDEKVISLSKENSALLLQIADLKRENAELAPKEQTQSSEEFDTKESQRIIGEQSKIIGEQSKIIAEHGKIVAGEVKKIVRAKVAAIKKDFPEVKEKIVTGATEGADKVSDFLNHFKKQ